MEKKLQKIYHTYYNLLIVLNLWQAHLQILLIIYMKEFIELNVNQDTVSIASIKKEKEPKAIDKNGEKITKNISYILHFTDSTKFMASSS